MKVKGKGAKTPRRAATGRTGAARAGAGRAGAGRVLCAGDLMTRDPVLVHDDITVGELCDLFQEKNINGAPVIDRQGRLVGVVAQDDIIYGAMGHADRSSTQDATRAAGVPGPEPDSPARRRSRRVAAVLREQKLRSLPDAAPRRGETPFWAEERRASDPLRMAVGAIMTSPAISAEESTPVTDLCEVMWNLRIHRVPIVNQGKVSGIVSSMDLCRAILSGLIKV